MSHLPAPRFSHGSAGGITYARARPWRDLGAGPVESSAQLQAAIMIRIIVVVISISIISITIISIRVVIIIIVALSRARLSRRLCPALGSHTRGQI